MSLDHKWLEILKARGWHLLALAAACGLLLFANNSKWIPILEPWMIQGATFGLFVFGLLSIAGLISASLKFLLVKEFFIRWVRIHADKKNLKKYIPHMTPKERQIIGYLLEKNQKTITADHDGGDASTLISRRIIRIIVVHNQQLDTTRVPMIVPDHLWDVLVKFKHEFPYVPEIRNKIEV